MFNISINDLEKIIIGPGCNEFVLEAIGSPQVRIYLAKQGYTSNFKVRLLFNKILKSSEEPLHFLTPGTDGTVGELIETVEKVLKTKLLLEGRFKMDRGPDSDFEGDEFMMFPSLYLNQRDYEFSGYARRIKVDFGVIVSDTHNRDVGMKIDLESGKYFWYNESRQKGKGSWVKQRPRK